MPLLCCVVVLNGVVIAASPYSSISWEQISLQSCVQCLRIVSIGDALIVGRCGLKGVCSRELCRTFLPATLWRRIIMTRLLFSPSMHRLFEHQHRRHHFCSVLEIFRKVYHLTFLSSMSLQNEMRCSIITLRSSGLTGADLLISPRYFPHISSTELQMTFRTLDKNGDSLDLIPQLLA